MSMALTTSVGSHNTQNVNGMLILRSGWLHLLVEPFGWA